MSRIIIHKRQSGKYDYTITGDDVNENIIAHSVQGYGSKKETLNTIYAVLAVLLGYNCKVFLAEEYMTCNEYTEWLRKHRNQLRRNSRARGRK